MAKSLRSKIKQRYRRAKRHFIERNTYTESINKFHEKVKCSQQGLAIQKARPQNAFLHPNDPEAIFPQKELIVNVDFRSESLPLSGYAVSGARRAFSEEETARLDLSVRCKDGPLEIEVVKALAEQKTLQHKKLCLSPDDVATQGSIDDQDAESQMANQIHRMNLAQEPQEFSLSDSTPHIPSLKDLQDLQDRVSGRNKKVAEVPKIKNKLKNKLKTK